MSALIELWSPEVVIQSGNTPTSRNTNCIFFARTRGPVPEADNQALELPIRCRNRARERAACRAVNMAHTTFPVSLGSV